MGCHRIVTGVVTVTVIIRHFQEGHSSAHGPAYHQHWFPSGTSRCANKPERIKSRLKSSAVSLNPALFNVCGTRKLFIDIFKRI